MALATALVYPAAYRGTDATSLFGTTVPDPYRWMENVNAPETRSWAASEDALTRSYLGGLPLRDALRARLKRLWDYDYAVSTKIYGTLRVRSYVSPVLHRPVIVARDGIGGRERTVLDSGEVVGGERVALDSAVFSRDGRYLAFATFRRASTAVVWRVRELDTRFLLRDRVRAGVFARVSWSADNRGFFYTTAKPSGPARIVYLLAYHRLREPSQRDRVAFAFATRGNATVATAATKDGRWVVLTVSQPGRPPRLFSVETRQAKTSSRELVEGRTESLELIDSLRDDLLFKRVDATCPDTCIERIDPRNPARDRVLVPDNGSSVRSAAIVGQTLFLLYSIDAHAAIVQFDSAGRRLRTLELPAVGTIDPDDFRDDGTGRYLSVRFTSYVIPPTLLAFDSRTGKCTVVADATVNYRPSAFVTDQRFFSSADGTRVPMFVTHARSLPSDGSSPTILYVYGGFGNPQEPVWTPEIVSWLSIGGVYAVVNARGGGEYGEAWHKAGIGMHKQNTIDDVIAAAEELRREGIADSAHLALRGDSNGGLVAANAALQRPDLFTAFISREGLLDLIRYDAMRGEETWKYEYGSKFSSAAAFAYMLHLSPVDAVQPGVSYPAALIQTGDADDIVSPAHSFKLVAALQSDRSQSNPVLLRVDRGVGHHGGEPLALVIEESVDQYSFLLNLMGVSKLKPLT